MGIAQISGVNELTEATQKLIEKSSELGSKMSQASERYTVWDTYRDRVAREIALNGSINDVETFDKFAQEYMDDYLEITCKQTRYKGEMFKFTGYREKYQDAIKQFFASAKEYKKSLKHTTKAVFKDPKGNNKLDEAFAYELNLAKTQFKSAKRVKIREFGLPIGLKIAKGFGIACAVGLAAWGAVKVYDYLFKPSSHKTNQIPPQYNTNPAQPAKMIPEVQASDTVKSADSINEPVVVESQEQAQTIDEPIVENQAVKTEEPVVDEQVVEEQVVEEPVVEEQVTQEVIAENSVEEQAQIQMPTVLTFPAVTKTAEPVKEAYIPISPFEYTIDYAAINSSAAENSQPKQEADSVSDSQSTKVEDKKKQAVSEADRAARRAAYNMAINKIKETLSVEGIECNSYTAVRGDTVSKIAIKTLKDEGISKPSASQINQRIALIALLNEMEDVNKLYVNQMVKIPSAELNAYIESNEELKQLLEMFMA